MPHFNLSPRSTMSAYATNTIPGEWTFYKMLTFIADILEDMFYRPIRRTERLPNEAAHWSKEEFLAKFDHSVPLEGSEAPFGGYLLFALDEHTVVKPKPLWDSDAELEREMQAWRYVWKHTTIPTPRYHQILTIDGDPGNGYIIMDYIQGERLDYAWPKLSIWSRFRVAWTLRGYVRQLRRAPVPPSAFPGPLGPFPRPCEGGAISYITPVQWMEPRPSAKALYDHIQEVAEGRCKKYRSQPELEKPKPFVFTHNDLNMRNVILGKDGLVYLIDWDFSGLYPPWFEYVSMTWSAAPVHRPPCPDWAWYCGFIADPYFAYYRWLGGYPS